MAIAFDAQGGIDADVGTGHSWTHICTGSNLILIVGFRNTKAAGGEDVTGVTYNSVAMTKLYGSLLGNGGKDYDYFYYLINPATGSHTVSVNTAGSTTLYGRSASYTGVKQSGFPDAQAQAQSSTGTSITASVTTVADNCWLVAFMDNEVNTTTAAGGTTYRLGALTTVMPFADSNGAKTPAGSYSLGMSWTGSGENQYEVASMAPFVAGATANPAFLLKLL